MRAMRRPESSEHAEYYGRYINLVPESDVVASLATQAEQTQKLVASLDDERAMFRYAPGKWSIKEVLGHVADSEKIFGYRLLALARGETQPLPGFDQEVYAAGVRFDEWPLRDIADYVASARRANLSVIRNLEEPAWDRAGIVSGNAMSVRALAFILVGHERHHTNVLRERYAVSS